jgi:O-antigen/teichoic acid export membrane protein
MSLKRNVVANYLGQGWRGLMGLAFVPLYIKYLGIETYGLIAIFALLQVWLGLLDMGMKPALNREMARFLGGAHQAQSIRDLLRSIVIIGCVIAGALALGIWVASGWLATHWVKTENLSAAMVAQAFAVMGVVVALRFIEDIYVSGIVGLQRQVLANVVGATMATARGFGAVGVLALVSPTLEAFFVWQGLVSLVTVIVYARAIHHLLPKCDRPARFSWLALLDVWHFAAGMIGVTLLGILLTQVDKILLSRLLDLKAYAYYALAGMVAGTMYLLGGPITSAFYPRFTELATRDDEVALRGAYHQAAQLMTVLAGTTAIVLMTFGDKLLVVWTNDPALALQVAPLMTVLVLGNLFNALASIPYYIQLAYGWTKLSIKINIVAVTIVVPAILWIVPKWGAIGAAWVWVALTASYVLVQTSLMHLRLLRGEKWLWYSQDVAIPLGTAAVTAGLCRWVIPNGLGKFDELCAVLTASTCVLGAAALSAPMLRHQLALHSPHIIWLIVSRALSLWPSRR